MPRMTQFVASPALMFSATTCVVSLFFESARVMPETFAFALDTCIIVIALLFTGRITVRDGPFSLRSVTGMSRIIRASIS